MNKAHQLPISEFSDLNSLSFFTQIENVSPQMIYKEYQIKQGEIFAKSEECSKSNDPYVDTRLLQSFVDIKNKKDIIKWVSRNGLLINKPRMTIEEFANYHKLISQLYSIVCAINDWQASRPKPLESIIKIRKLYDFRKEHHKDHIDHMGHQYVFIQTFGCMRDGKPIKEMFYIGNEANCRDRFVVFLYDYPSIILSRDEIEDEYFFLPIIAITALSHVLNTQIAKGLTFFIGDMEASDGITPYRIIPKIKADNLIMMMFYQLLWLISTQIGLKRCKRCGHYFSQDNERPRPRRQVYCKLCGVHAAQHKYRSDKRLAVKLYMT